MDLVLASFASSIISIVLWEWVRSRWPLVFIGTALKLPPHPDASTRVTPYVARVPDPLGPPPDLWTRPPPIPDEPSKPRVNVPVNPFTKKEWSLN